MGWGILRSGWGQLLDDSAQGKRTRSITTTAWNSTIPIVGAVVGEFVNADRGLGYLIVVDAVNLKHRFRDVQPNRDRLTALSR